VKCELTIGEKFELGYPIDEALERAYRQTMRIHKKLGQSVVSWRDGKVVIIPPEEVPDFPEEKLPWED
jgi:hypothetical protein